MSEFPFVFPHAAHSTSAGLSASAEAPALRYQPSNALIPAHAKGFCSERIRRIPQRIFLHPEAEESYPSTPEAYGNVSAWCSTCVCYACSWLPYKPAPTFSTLLGCQLEALTLAASRRAQASQNAGDQTLRANPRLQPPPSFQWFRPEAVTRAASKGILR